MRINFSLKQWFSIVCILVLLPLSHFALSNIYSTEDTIGDIDVCFPYDGPGGCGWTPELPAPGECGIIYESTHPVIDIFGNYTFSLADESYPGLSIDPFTGLVTLCADEQLYEQYSEISFSVLVTDSAGNISSQTVILSIPNYDTTPPMVNLSCNDIEENSGAGQVVCQAIADDSADISDGVTFSLTNDSDPTLTIDAVTGEVILTVDPDYEVQNEYSLAVIATDAAGNSASVSAQVTIIDIDESKTPIEFSITSSAFGFDAFGINCDISLDSDDNCVTPGELNNQQAVYVASSTIVGSHKIVTIGYASDEKNLAGIGFELNFDNSKLSLFSVSNVFAGAIASGSPVDGDTLVFGWASLFYQFPGANQVNLATVTFDIIGYEPPTQLEQIISVNNTPMGVLGRTSVLEVAYDTTDNNNQLSGLGMRVHFDSSLLSFKEVTDLIDQDIIVNGEGPFSDDVNYDNDPLTDQYMLFGWASLYNNWPNRELPTVLMNIAFDVSDTIDIDVTPSTNINFTDSSFTAGYEFSANSYVLEFQRATWDFDGDGNADALTDGLMMIRYLFGLRAELVTFSAMSDNSTLSPEEVIAEIEAALDIMDIDADGEFNALTDGLLLLRYLFGLRDDSLTNGAVGADATRSSNEDIQNYLESHMPAL
jgi:hypothetical protein